MITIVTLLALWTQLIATACMTGLIWFVQVVHYPSMLRVGRGNFVVYERGHVKATTCVVAPLMLAEAAAVAALLAMAPAAFSLAGGVLLAIIWLSTAAIQVPCHRRLERGFDPQVLRRLVRSNWVRTIGWSVRLVLAAIMLSRGMSPCPAAV